MPARLIAEAFDRSRMDVPANPVSANTRAAVASSCSLRWSQVGTRSPDGSNDRSNRNITGHLAVAQGRGEPIFRAMQPSFDSLVAREGRPTPEPLLSPRWWVVGIIVAALVVAYYAVMFPYEYRHPIDDVDVVRELANFL